MTVETEPAGVFEFDPMMMARFVPMETCTDENSWLLWVLDELDAIDLDVALAPVFVGGMMFAGGMIDAGTFVVPVLRSEPAASVERAASPMANNVIFIFIFIF